MDKKRSLLLKTMQETEGLNRMMTTIEEKLEKHLSLKETSEQGIRKRADTVHRWVDKYRDEALENLQSFNKDMMARLSETKALVQKQAAALSAKAICVLRDDKAADIVALEAALKDLTMDAAQQSQPLGELSNEMELYRCENNPCALTLAGILDYICVFKGTASGNATSLSQETPTESPASTNTDLLCAASAVQVVVPAHSSFTVTEILYSENSSSEIVAMCTTSEMAKLWIKYRPKGEREREEMGLFSEKGLVEKVGTVLPGDSIVTVKDITIGSGGKNMRQWIRTDGTWGTTNPTKYVLTRFAKCGNECFANGSASSDTETQIFKIKFKSKSKPATIQECSTIAKNSPGSILDVSESQNHFALLAKDTLGLYIQDKQCALKQRSSYSQENQKILDACFFSVDGQEMLVVVVEGDDMVHVVDHTDGCRFVRYLDTGPVKLDRPFCLATDHEKVLWIGCQGGKAVLLKL